MRQMAFALCFALAGLSLIEARQARGPAAPPNPVMVMDTVKGSIEIQLFQSDAPKSVAHIIELVKKGFYRSTRFHREENSLVQFGDQLSRDMTRERFWGTGNSGNPIGVAELSKRRHIRGIVSLANGGNILMADSQMFIMKTASPSLDGKYTIIGQVTKGMDVVDKIQRTDLIKLVTIKEAAPK